MDGGGLTLRSDQSGAGVCRRWRAGIADDSHPHTLPRGMGIPGRVRHHVRQNTGVAQPRGAILAAAAGRLKLVTGIAVGPVRAGPPGVVVRHQASSMRLCGRPLAAGERTGVKRCIHAMEKSEQFLSTTSGDGDDM